MQETCSKWEKRPVTLPTSLNWVLSSSSLLFKERMYKVWGANSQNKKQVQQQQKTRDQITLRSAWSDPSFPSLHPSSCPQLRLLLQEVSRPPCSFASWLLYPHLLQERGVSLWNWSSCWFAWRQLWGWRRVREARHWRWGLGWELGRAQRSRP